MYAVMDATEPSGTMTLDRESPESTDHDNREAQAVVRELLAILPADVLGDIRSGEIDARDPDFINGLMDHASRLAVADPQKGRRMLGKIIRLRKLLNRSLRESDPGAVTSATVVGDSKRVGRNGACPCGSGRKFKQCCIRKSLQVQ
ncbi:MAG: SEC-C domain-containing protein [Pirellulaceae bacterium]|nr:SEC-C domain-containing protein [Pirellulaceae bacterium]